MTTVTEPLPPGNVRRTPPNPRLWPILWIGIALGVAVTLVLVWHSYQLASGGGDKTWLPGCGPGQSCDSILQSPYATVLGYSLTKWSLAFYALLGLTMLVVAYSWQLPLSPPISLLLPVVTFIGVVAAGWSVTIMAKELHQVCYWCLALDGINLFLFLITVLYARQDWQHRQFVREEAGVPQLPLAPIVLHCVLALLIGGAQLTAMTQFHGPVRVETPRVAIPGYGLGVRKMQPNQVQVLTLPDANPMVASIKGSPGAPHRLVVFSCLTCPKCRELNSLLRATLERHPRQLRVDERFYPLWHACNDRINSGVMDARHKDACVLSRLALAIAVAKPAAFTEFVDWVFDNQGKIDEAAATREALKHVDQAALDRAMDDPAVWQRLRKDVELANQLNINSVPRIFLPSGQVYGGLNAENFEALLAEEFKWQAPPTDQKKADAVWLGGEMIEAHAQRGVALAQRRQYVDAVRELKESLRLKSDWSEAAIQLAWILATCPDKNVRDGAAAVRYARLAQTTAKSETPQMFDALAAALAETGQYREATDAERQAVALYLRAGAEQQAQKSRARMELYIRRLPYHEE
ncbi:MAG: thioredoxin domain-containing protein [Planctomycetia bacterium]|nr:thioredoxin domain-containing protein [Planctomycetia bacterium]